MKTEKQKFTITCDEELLNKIDDFWFENRFRNRTQATLELIRLGLNAAEKEKENVKKPR